MNGSRDSDSYNKLIPEMSQWNNGKGIDIESWLMCMGNFELAVAFGWLFWPQFKIHDDCILAVDIDLSTYQLFLKEANGNKQFVESRANHLCLVDLFHQDVAKPSDALLFHLGELLQDAWGCKLIRDFPDRKITVPFTESGGDFMITAYQERGVQNQDSE